MINLNYNINLIPDFRLRKKLLDITPITVNGRRININPIMTTNLLIIEKNTRKYMSDKLAMLYNSIVRDNTLVVTGKGLVTRSYVIKYHMGKLSITFSNKLTLTVTLSKKMTALIDNDRYKYNRTNFAVMLYVASAIMNIPKYEYPITIVDNDTHVSTIDLKGVDVLYIDKDVLPYPKKIKKVSTNVSTLISKLRDYGDVLSYASDIEDSTKLRILALINYCRYYDVVTSRLINTLLENVSTVAINDNHLDNMILYMHTYRDILNIKDKYNNHVPKKQIN